MPDSVSLEIHEIRDRMRALSDEEIKSIRSIIETASKDVIRSDFQGYGSDFSRDAQRWFDSANIKRVSSTSIQRCRQTLIEAEAHHQFSSHFVALMIEDSKAIVGKLPARIGDFPEMRAAANFTTMVSNHELYLFSLVSGQQDAPTFNKGIPMSQRYYVSQKTAGPFIEYQAKVMAGIGLWDVELKENGTRKSYMVRPGPFLECFMEHYLKIVEWAEVELAKVTSELNRQTTD